MVPWVSQLAGSGWSSFIKNSDLLLRTLTGSRVINAANSTPEISMKIIKACFYIARVEIALVLAIAKRYARRSLIYRRKYERTWPNFGETTNTFKCLSSILSLLIVASDRIRIGMRSFQILRGRDFLFPNGGMHSLR